MTKKDETEKDKNNFARTPGLDFRLFSTFVTLAVDRFLNVDVHGGQEARDSLSIPVEAAGKLYRPFTVAAFTATMTLLQSIKGLS